MSAPMWMRPRSAGVVGAPAKRGSGGQREVDLGGHPGRAEAADALRRRRGRVASGRAAAAASAAGRRPRPRHVPRCPRHPRARRRRRGRPAGSEPLAPPRRRGSSAPRPRAARRERGGERAEAALHAARSSPHRCRRQAAACSSRFAVVPADHGPAIIPWMPRAATTARCERRLEPLLREVRDRHGSPAQQVLAVAAAEAPQRPAEAREREQLAQLEPLDVGRRSSTSRPRTLAMRPSEAWNAG